MPATLIPSAGCCVPCDDSPVVVSTPGPLGPQGDAGLNGVDGIDATTVTTAQFTVPASGNNVTITVNDGTFIPQIANSAIIYLSIGNAGYFEIVSKIGNSVTVKNSAAVSASNAANGTVVAAGAIVSLAGPQGAAGANGAGGAPDIATYILQTANGSLGSAQVLAILASGFVKVTNGTGILSSTPTVPVASVSGNWSLTNTTGTLPVARGGTNLTSYTVGDIVYASGATTLASLADVATGNALLSGGVGVAPAYGKVGLTTHVSGVLPVANGGRGLAAFNYVYAYSAGTQNINATTSATVIFGTESFDTGNTFNNGTGVWTPGVVGKVFIVANILGSWGSSGTNRVKLSIKRNGTIVYTKVCDWVNHNVDTSHSISGVFDSAANTDTFEVNVENLSAHTFTLNTTAQGTSFFGYVIGA